MDQHGLMNLSISGLAAGLFFSVIGFWLIRQGKLRANIPVIVIGVLLFGYTYFTTSPWTDWGIGFGLCGAAYSFWRN
jgi:hypothetical protein